MRNGTEKKERPEMDEVEQLLQAAHDDVLLKLSLNSHTLSSSSSSSSLDPDVTRRFQALKSGPFSTTPKPQPNPSPNAKPNPKSKPSPISPSVPVDDELKAVLGDDLSARFAALKGSLYSTSSTAATATATSVGPMVVSSEGGNKGDEEDEVEKLIQWAIDAARLDPSPPSDLDDNTDNEDEDDDDDEDDEEDVKRKKENEKNKKKEKTGDKKSSRISILF